MSSAHDTRQSRDRRIPGVQELTCGLVHGLKIRRAEVRGDGSWDHPRRLMKLEKAGEAARGELAGRARVEECSQASMEQIKLVRTAKDAVSEGVERQTLGLRLSRSFTDLDTGSHTS